MRLSVVVLDPCVPRNALAGQSSASTPGGRPKTTGAADPPVRLPSGALANRHRPGACPRCGTWLGSGVDAAPLDLVLIGGKESDVEVPAADNDTETLPC